MEMLVRAYDPCISCSTHVIYLDGDDSSSLPTRQQEVTP